MIKKLLLKTLESFMDDSKAQDERYQLYINEHEPDARELDRQRRRVFADMPQICVICPLCNPKKKDFIDIVESLQAQTYANWTLLFPDTSMSREREYNAYLLEEYDKVRHIPLRSNFGLSRAAHEAACVACKDSDFLLFIVQDGLLAPFALYSMVEAVLENHADFVYADEDVLDSERQNPFFKPDWSPDLLESMLYTGRPTLMSAALYERAGGLLETPEGAHEYDLALRATRMAKSVVHVPKILYHTRLDAGPNASAGANARRSTSELCEPGLFPGSCRVRYPIKGRPLVSVILRHKGSAHLLERCVSSFIERTTYANREILLYTGESRENLASVFERLERDGVSIRHFTSPFNETSAANALAKATSGEYLLFMDSNVEAVTPDWLESMLEHAQRESVGAVGAKLIAPSGNLRHCGIVVGLSGSGYLCDGLPDTSDCSILQNVYSNAVRNVSAVSSACLLVKRETFMDAGLFDESFIKIGCDVELCLRLIRKGLRNIYTPFAKLRQNDAPSIEAPRSDTMRSYDACRHIIKQGDPFYNINLDYECCEPRVVV